MEGGGSTAPARCYRESRPGKRWRTESLPLGSCPSLWCGVPLAPLWGGRLWRELGSQLSTAQDQRLQREVETLDWNPGGLRGTVRNRAGMVSIWNGEATGDLLAVFIWKEGLHGRSAFDIWHCSRRKAVSWQWGS